MAAGVCRFGVLGPLVLERDDEAVPPASAVSALHVHLSKLRELVGDLVVRDTAGYSLRPGGFELDCLRFDTLLDEARTAPERARGLLREALASQTARS